MTVEHVAYFQVRCNRCTTVVSDPDVDEETAVSEAVALGWKVLVLDNNTNHHICPTCVPLFAAEANVPPVPQ